MLQTIIREKWLQARAVVGLFPANQIHEDDICVKLDQGDLILHQLRQQNRKPAGRPNRCLSDFIAPVETGLTDYIGAFAVTTGIGIDEHVRRFEELNDDYRAILLKALADRLAEAFAERMHERVRKEFWGYAAVEELDNNALIKEQYQGIRPAPGYPACPDHTRKGAIVAIDRPREWGRYRDYRELRHAADSQRIRLVLQSSAVRLLWTGQDQS